MTTRIQCEQPLKYSERLGLLPREEEYRLAGIIQSAAPEDERRAARDKLVLHNLRAAVDIAKRYANDCITMDDALQQCYMGMLYAAENFKPEEANGGRFINYAIWHMKCQGQRIQQHKWPFFSAPHHVANMTHQVKKAIGYDFDLGDDAVVERMKEAGQRDEARYRQGLDGYRLATSAVYLDSEIDSGLERHGAVADQGAWAAADSDSQLDIGTVIGYANENLSPMHFVAMVMRHSDEVGEGLTLEQVGRTIGRSRERIRQLCDEAIEAIADMIKEDREEGNPPPARAEWDMDRYNRIVAEIQAKGSASMVRECRYCGDDFRTRSNSQKFCSWRCRAENYEDQRRIMLRRNAKASEERN